MASFSNVDTSDGRLYQKQPTCAQDRGVANMASVGQAHLKYCPHTVQLPLYPAQLLFVVIQFKAVDPCHRQVEESPS